jgi:virginiamycin B lyase
MAGAFNLASGPDGNLWVTDNVSVARVDTTGKLLNKYSLPTTYDGIARMATGSADDVWYAGNDGGYGGVWALGRIKMTGDIVEYKVQNARAVEGITQGPDGALWFTETTKDGAAAIGRITVSGAITEYPIAGSGRIGGAIVTGPDGNIWFGYQSKVGRITPAGVITLFPIPIPAGYTGSYYDTNPPKAMVKGADNNLWFTVYGAPYLGRVWP